MDELVVSLYYELRVDGELVDSSQDLEGETLAQRLSKGALSLDQALQVAIQIADALAESRRSSITRTSCRSTT